MNNTLCFKTTHLQPYQKNMLVAQRQHTIMLWVPMKPGTGIGKGTGTGIGTENGRIMECW